MSSEAVQPVNKRRRRSEKEGVEGEKEVTKNVDTETSATTSKPTTSQIEEKSQVRKYVGCKNAAARCFCK